MEENKITKQDYAQALERYIRTGNLTKEDEKIIKDSPFCTCDVLAENPEVEQLFQEFLKNVVKNLHMDLTEVQKYDYVMFDSEVTHEFYHPELEGYVPSLSNVSFTKLWDDEENLHIIETTPAKIEKYLLEKGYELLRFDYNRVYYYKRK